VNIAISDVSFLLLCTRNLNYQKKIIVPLLIIIIPAEHPHNSIKYAMEKRLLNRESLPNRKNFNIFRFSLTIAANSLVENIIINTTAPYAQADNESNKRRCLPFMK